MISMRTRSLLLAFMLSTTATACGGGQREWAAQAIDANGVAVDPIRVWIAGNKLWVRTNMRNNGPLPVMVDRDAITVALPTGEALHRSAGSFGIHTPYAIPPGGSHLVYVEFLAGSARWSDVPEAQLNFQGAVTVNGQPIALPPMPLSHQ